MKTAKKGTTILSLNTYNRDDYQRLYEDGKKGLLTCPTCSQSVRFYLGIEKEPHFYHILSDSNCQDEAIAIDNEPSEEEKIEHTGFILPRSRSISATIIKEQTYRAAQAVKGIPHFTPTTAKNQLNTTLYMQSLQESGISLDHQQLQAVTAPIGPLLVLAGAGSGKTRVLTARTAYLLTEKAVDPRSIMLVTFTAKAAGEMKARLTAFPNLSRNVVQSLVAGTFHSLFFRIVAHHQPNKWQTDSLLKQEWQRSSIVKEAGKSLGLDEKEFAYDAALQQISLWKNTLLLPNQVKPSSAFEEKTALLYSYYEEYKKEKQLFDFDDMLTGCYQLFIDHPEILERYQNRFTTFLIDEFQDINKVQYELMKLLSAKTKNVCAVGDDDQAIYAFRGSDPSYLRDFEVDFPSATIVTLDENYRSSHSIVSTANQIIIRNKLRRAKSMKAQFASEHVPMTFYPEDEEQEATMIITDMAEKIANGAEPKDFAVLYRTNTASRAIFERLVHSSLPFSIEQDTEAFYERFIIKSMLSFLRLSIDEDDAKAISNIFPALFIKQSVLRDLKADSILQDKTLLECLATIQTGFAFQERKLKKLIPTIRSLSSLSPLRAIDIVEKELGFQDFVKKRGNEGNGWDKGSDDIRDLRVAAQLFPTIREFLAHADHMSAMNKEMKKLSKQRDNCITLSTIHRAKGLEYKNVYILGVVDGSLPHDYALESLRSGNTEPLEEERRLLYVAATRAKEQLYLSLLQKRRGKKAVPSRFLNTIRKT